ncbi:MAG: hypothetical protein M3O46_03570, partial [Myxococcota bacterium]|nr:hypothetical protein [Myxococcota bacterium]
DCPPAADKTQQHCVPDALGNGFCSPQCATNSNCPFDATCHALSWGICAQKICKTDADCRAFASAETCIAGACRGSCTADADCPPSNGVRQHCSGGSCVAQACASDDDCSPARGIFQHCNAGACTPECAADADCNATVGDQSCVPLSVCTPRAGVCVGDGTFCAPCGSDFDCLNGFCLAAPYSTERFCSQAMQGGAKCASGGPPSGSCPTHPSGSNYKAIACTTTSDDFAPANTCIAEVTFGTIMGMAQYVPGCWTLNR